MRWFAFASAAVGVPSLFSTSEYADELKVGLSAVREAMVMAKKVQSESLESMTKMDESPVTVADFAAQAMVLSRIHESYPSDGFIAEESSSSLDEKYLERTAMAAGMSPEELCAAIDLDGDHESRKWILDPIDGTKGFLRGEQFCCALCLLVDGVPVASVLGCPNLGDHGGTYAVAIRGRGAFVSEGGEWKRLRIGEGRVGEPLGLVEGVSRLHSNHDWSEAAFAEIVSDETGRKETLRYDSQAKAVVLASGRADVFMRLPRVGYVEKIWDAAPAYLVVSEAGGEYTDRRGRQIDFSLGDSLHPQVDGIVATNKHLHPHLVRALEITEELQR